MIIGQGRVVERVRFWAVLGLSCLKEAGGCDVVVVGVVGVFD